MWINGAYLSRACLFGSRWRALAAPANRSKAKADNESTPLKQCRISNPRRQEAQESLAEPQTGTGTVCWVLARVIGTPIRAARATGRQCEMEIALQELVRWQKCQRRVGDVETAHVVLQAGESTTPRPGGVQAVFSKRSPVGLAQGSRSAGAMLGCGDWLQRPGASPAAPGEI